MTTVEKDDGSFYGLGIENDFDSFKQEIWEHNGGTLGYSSWMVWIKNSDIVIAIIISDTTKDRNDIDLSLIHISHCPIVLKSRGLISILQDCSSSARSFPPY